MRRAKEWALAREGAPANAVLEALQEHAAALPLLVQAGRLASDVRHARLQKQSGLGCRRVVSVALGA